MSTLYEYYNSGNDSYNAVYGNIWCGQSFTTVASFSISSVKLFLNRTGDPGTITVSIKATSGGLPTDDDLCSGTISGSSITYNPVGAWYEITFSSPYTLDAETKYAIIVRTSASFPNILYWHYDHTSPTYAGGSYHFSANGGSSWSANTGTDFMFETWGNPILPGKPTNPTPADEESGIALHSTTVTWESGGNTDSYNIYFGTLSGFLSLVAEGVTELEATLVTGNFTNYGFPQYWRVDAVNDAGITQGDEWYLTTILFDTIIPTGMSLVDGELTGTPTGENNMITVRRLVAAANSKIWYEDL